MKTVPFLQTKIKNTDNRFVCVVLFLCMYEFVYGRVDACTCTSECSLCFVSSFPSSIWPPITHSNLPLPASSLLIRQHSCPAAPDFLSHRRQNNVTENKTITSPPISRGPCGQSWVTVGANPCRSRWSLTTSGRRDRQRGSPAVRAPCTSLAGHKGSLACPRLSGLAATASACSSFPTF